MEGSSVPIIDLEKVGKCLEDGNPDNYNAWISTAKEMRKYCGEIGFIQLINHGIPSKIIAKAFEQGQQFFALPQETKMKYRKPKIENFESYYGFTETGMEKNYRNGEAVFEYREMFDCLDAGGIYPEEELPEFENAIASLRECCRHLTMKIFKLWAMGLEMDDLDFFIKKHQHLIDCEKFKGLTNLKLAYYPGMMNNIKIPDGSYRVIEHTDVGSLTFVFQDDVGGLEAKTVSGNWISVDPIPGAIVMNTGDMMEFWTSGLFSATPHRIRIPECEINKRLPRYSVVYFSGPDASEIVTPLTIKRTPDEESRLIESAKTYSSEPVKAVDYVTDVLKAAYATANEEESIKASVR